MESLHRQIDRHFAQIEIRQDARGFQFAGYAAVYYRSNDPGTEYRVGDFTERIEQRAFDGVLSTNPDVMGLYNHDHDNLLGKTSAGTVRLRGDDHGLYFEIDYDDRDPDHQRAAAKARRGELGASFGFRAPDDTWENNIRSISGFGELIDVSVVSNPAYKATSAEIAEIRSSHAQYFFDDSEYWERRRKYLQHRYSKL